MKKTLTVLIVLGAMTVAAEDSYLYWMVGDNHVDYTYSTVKVRDANNSNPNTAYLTIYNASGVEKGESIGKGTVDTYRDLDRGLYASIASLGYDPTYSSFVIELWNGSSFVAQSSELSYSAALADYIVHNNSMTLPTAWVASSFAIPEPNSAMLLLLGCAALGLRRRCQLKA